MQVRNIPRTIARMWLGAVSVRLGGFGYRLKTFFTIFRHYINRRLFPKRKSVTSSFLGHTMTFSTWESAFYLFREIFLRDEYFLHLNKKNPKILDCGANVGMSIVYLKRLFPQAEIKAFEPNPIAYGLLERNVQQNNLQGVTLHQAALSNSDEPLLFYQNEEDASLLASLRADRASGAPIEVPALRLSDFMKNEMYDLVKIDVEGAEWQILEDLLATNCLSNAQQYIIEYHHQIAAEKGRLAEFLAAFEAAGYWYSLRPTYVEAKGYQNVVLHFYKNIDTAIVDEEYW